MTFMRELYSSKHIAYWVLRHIGDRQLAHLEGLLPALPPSDQTYVLHAMDQFLSNPEVVAFYRRFIDATPHELLRNAAKKYADGFL